MKFEELLNKEFPGAISTIDRIKKLSNQYGEILSENIKRGECKGDKFNKTALQFNRINYEAIDAILLLLNSGHLTESVVLLRWHLEMVNLFYFLANNKLRYEKWLIGEQIRPKEIGEFIEKAGLETGSKAYFDWSDFVHLNSPFVENSSFIAKMNIDENGQIIFLNRVLCNMMQIAHKINLVIDPLIKHFIPKSSYLQITNEFNQIHDLIIKLDNVRNEKESDFF